MKSEDLYRKIVGHRKVSSVAWSFSIEYRNKFYTCVTNNSLAIDRINTDVEDRVSKYGYTYFQAYKALYDECKRKNNLR